MLAAARILIVVNPAGAPGVPYGRRARSKGRYYLRLLSLPPLRRGEAAFGRQGRGPSVERVARFTWWRSMCLERALAGKWMLRRRGIPSTMFVGMARQGEQFVAHAWLVGEGLTLTGAGKTAYAPLAVFREPRA